MTSRRFDREQARALYADFLREAPRRNCVLHVGWAPTEGSPRPCAGGLCRRKAAGRRSSGGARPLRIPARSFGRARPPRGTQMPRGRSLRKSCAADLRSRPVAPVSNPVQPPHCFPEGGAAGKQRTALAFGADRRISSPLRGAACAGGKRRAGVRPVGSIGRRSLRMTGGRVCASRKLGAWHAGLTSGPAPTPVPRSRPPPP